MSCRLQLLGLLLLALFAACHAAPKSADYYKLLEVDKTASQRDIKKAFHRQSLKFHPDKNPGNEKIAKKFAEISAAYDTLSDEKKRQIYDQYGEAGLNGGAPEGGFARPGAGFQGGGFPGGGRTHFSFQGGSGGPGMEDIFSSVFGQASQAKQGASGSSFSFGGGSGGGAGGGGGIFENLFGGFGGGGGQSADADVWGSLKRVEKLSAASFADKVQGPGNEMWLVLFYLPQSQESAALKPEFERAAEDLDGLVKFGVVNCKDDRALCQEHGVSHVPNVQFYQPGKKAGTGFTGEPTGAAIKRFAVANIPNHSLRLDESNFERRFGRSPDLPRAVLFTNKPSTPAMWRTLSGRFLDKVVFFEVQVDDVSKSELASRFGVRKLPTVVGLLPGGDQVLFTGDAKKLATISKWLSELQKKGEAQAKGGLSTVPVLNKVTRGVLCSGEVPVCVIAVVSSAQKGKQAREILAEVARSIQAGRRSGASSIGFALLDEKAQPDFLPAFPDARASAGAKKPEMIVIAYKPKRGRYASYVGRADVAAVEGFVLNVLSGDETFHRTKHEPVLK